ncbi:hypothetical protein SLI_0065 [Streptomyces lividans 1326]|uniref:Uncharacterized protein n=1 Tax=Streptomyces lividans 1326 TaxID=1200984 RepID=A0A7U9H8C3_STRLI|nr:hypothetical protein SLI_0065 [Streptomyces lividans 1326]
MSTSCGIPTARPFLVVDRFPVSGRRDAPHTLPASHIRSRMVK